MFGATMQPLRRGFTLVELLVTLTILSILATIGFGQYRSAQIKARDAQRKADLGNIARALEMYYSDHRQYPLSTSEGYLQVEGQTIKWGEPFEDAETIYMKQLPEDPLTAQDATYRYCYQSDAAGSFYKLYARLENTNDPDAKLDVTCAGQNYNYGVSSTNTQP